MNKNVGAHLATKQNVYGPYGLGHDSLKVGIHSLKLLEGNPKKKASQHSRNKFSLNKGHMRCEIISRYHVLDTSASMAMERAIAIMELR